MARVGDAAVPFLLAGLVLALPLEFTRQYFPLPAFDLSRLFMVLAIGTLALQVILGHRPLVVPRRFSLLALAVLTAYASVSAIAGGAGNGKKTALAMIVYAAVMIVVYNWALQPARAGLAWTALAVSSLALALTGLALQATHSYIWNPSILGNGFMRVSASFADPNNFARFLGFTMGAAIVMFADRGRNRWQLLFAAAALAAAVATPFTYSRAGWVIFGLCAALAVVVAKQRRRAAVLTAVTIGLFVAVVVLNPGTFARAQLIEHNLIGPLAAGGRFAWLNYLPLDSVRLYLAAAGLQMFLDHPVFGVGFGGFQHQILTTYHAFIPIGDTTSLPHTSVVAILAELGVVGALLAAVVFGSLFWEAWRAIRSLSASWPVACFVIALAAILLASQFAARLFDEPYLWVLLGLFYAALSRDSDWKLLNRNQAPPGLGDRRPADR